MRSPAESTHVARPPARLSQALAALLALALALAAAVALTTAGPAPSA